MDGSAVNGNAPVAFVDDLASWRSQYASPIDTPQHFAPDPTVSAATAPIDTKPTLGAMDSQISELDQLQRLSNTYEPVVEGPLISELKSSKLLIDEYANADPAFVRKTVALAPKYAYYRTVRGDGNCGWRALAFRFLEILLKTGDQNQIGMEHARIKSLNGLMDASGLQSYIYEDFADVTFGLLTSFQEQPDPAELFKSFNDQQISDAVVTHFKFLTSACMKASPEVYEPFLLGVPVTDYCAANIEPYGTEIDHAGLMALVDCLIIPAGMAVEVYYLDRASGDEVTIHRFERREGDYITPPNAPVIRLLYRPGHYDILYKREEVDVPNYQPNLQVSFLSHLPQQTFQPTPLACGIDPSHFDLGYGQHPQASSSPGPSNFRHSMLSIPEFQPSPFQSLPFQTTTFRNSPFNPSHFQSENFQPEIYQPPTSPTSRRSDRHS